mmetsp:Transcript_109354/g.314944  ORF Transcript_109354/g.314944 Transcript_109354/m.314944 type:complete len:353 (-) Transcript_109354:89-1147(-)
MAGTMPGDWNCPNCGDHQFARNVSCRKCGTPKDSSGGCSGYGGSMMAGFGGVAAGGMGGGARLGDWNCPSCSDLQFARNSSCRRCGTPKPMGGGCGGGMMGGSGMGGCCGGGDMRPGDWMCPSCGDHQFARNDVCRRCGSGKPGGAGAVGGGGCFGGGGMKQLMGGCSGCGGGVDPVAMGGKPGDWVCPSCGDLQFARNTSCRRCGQPSPALGGGIAACMGGMGGMMGAMAGVGGMLGGGAGGGGMGGRSNQTMMPGDWTCPNCSDVVFAKNAACRRCGTGKLAGVGAGIGMDGSAPHGGGNTQQPKPGDWYCPGCQDLQFARNPACRRCGTAKPAETLGVDTRGRSRSPRH